MAERARPPADITPTEFFTRWVPAHVAADAARRAQLARTEATLEFELTGEGGGTFTVEIAAGAARGAAGAAGAPDLRVRVDVPTWRALNDGTLSAPRALLARRLELHGDLLLALKLHAILG